MSKAGSKELHHNGQAYLIAYASWVLLGAVLVVRAFIISFQRIKLLGKDDLAARKREVQRQFQIVGMIWLATLPLLLGVYYFTRR